MVFGNSNPAGSFQPKAVLLDLDRTILTSTAAHEETCRKVCEQFASQIQGTDIDRLVRTVREISDWYWNDPDLNKQGRLNMPAARRYIYSITFDELGIDAALVAHKLADSYGAEREKAIALYPQAIETLKHFRNCGYRLALLTNGSSGTQRSKIERFNLAPHFDCILIEGECGVGKPDERIFLHALEQLNATAQEAWMIGDDLERDIAGAQKLGIFTIWVDWEGKGLPSSTPAQPDRIIRTIAELLS